MDRLQGGKGQGAVLSLETLIAMAFGSAHVALLVGIFYRLGGHNARLAQLEVGIEKLWLIHDGKGKACAL